MNRPSLLITLAGITLFSLLGLQIYYVVKAANLKEEQFNESVSMALCQVAEKMCSDTESCKGWDACCMNSEHGTEDCNIRLTEDQKVRMDSLLKHYMDFYHVTLDYSYKVVRTDEKIPIPGRSETFEQRLDPGIPGKYQLQLNVPGKDQFILSEMKGIFISTILLILAMIIIFALTIRALIRNTRTLQRTTDFVNNMTHELNTPISNIGLAASGLSKSGATEERKSTYLQIIRNENERLKRQVERLLDIAKLESTGLITRKETVDMHQLIDSQIKGFMILASDLNGTIESELKAENINVIGDPLLLSNVISNLLDNAIKYSEEKPKIKVLTYNSANRFCLSVTDKGNGISPSELPLIFEKYYRVNTGDVHNIKGFGLGLTYVKKVLDTHGGTINVESTVGKGSTFTIEIPLA